MAFIYWVSFIHGNGGCFEPVVGDPSCIKFMRCSDCVWMVPGTWVEEG